MRFLSAAKCLRLLLVILAVAIPAAGGLAQDNKKPLPRFASLDSREVNLRAGPGKDYPILWVYQRKGLPVEIIQEFENWRRIRDQDGTLGWVQQNLLSGRRTVKVTGAKLAMLAKPEQAARTVAYLEAGVIARLRECRQGSWCRIEVEDYTGWVPREGLWGLREGEVIDAD